MYNMEKITGFLKNEVESREEISIIHDLDAKKSLSNDNKIEHRSTFADKQSKCKPRYQYNRKGYNQNSVSSTELMNFVNMNSCFCNSIDHNSELCYF